VVDPVAELAASCRLQTAPLRRRIPRRELVAREVFDLSFLPDLVLRPHRVVERHRNGDVAHDDDDLYIIDAGTSGVVHAADVAGRVRQSDAVLERGRVEHGLVLRR
jgi:hypothetical protein